MLHSSIIPLAKTGINACGVLQQTAVASAKPDTMKQEHSLTCRFIQAFVSRIYGHYNNHGVRYAGVFGSLSNRHPGQEDI